MFKTASEYLQLAVKMCQKQTNKQTKTQHHNDSSPMTSKVFSNWVRRILLSEMQSLKVFLQVFLCNTKQKQISCKGQELTNTHTHTHTHTHTPLSQTHTHTHTHTPQSDPWEKARKEQVLEQVIWVQRLMP